MAPLEHEEVGAEEQVELVEDDAKSLWTISQSPEFPALVRLLKKYLKRARKGLDDWKRDDPQNNGFNRGNIWLVKQLYRELTITADPKRVMPNNV